MMVDLTLAFSLNKVCCLIDYPTRMGWSCHGPRVCDWPLRADSDRLVLATSPSEVVRTTPDALLATVDSTTAATSLADMPFIGLSFLVFRLPLLATRLRLSFFLSSLSWGNSHEMVSERAEQSTDLDEGGIL